MTYHKVIPSNCILYADDTTLIDVCKSTTSAVERAENHLAIADDWFRVNGFLLNKEKTQKLIGSLKPASGNLKPISYLGFTLILNLVGAITSLK